MASSATVGALKVMLSADSAQFSQGVKQAEGSLSSFVNAIGKGRLAVAAAFTAMAGAATLAVASMRRVANIADDMGKAAQKVGVMSEELSALKYTAGLAGVSFENLQTSLVRLTRSMSEVAKGSEGDAAKAFTALGVSVKNADGTLRSSAEVMGDIAQKFSEYQDGAEKTALAVAIFGRAGAAMIPMLNMGRDAIAESNEEARKFGVTISGEVAKAAENFNDNLSRLGSMVDGVLVRAFASAAPVMDRLSAALVQAAKDSNGFQVAAEGVAKTMSSLIEFGASVVRTLREISAVFTGIGMAAAAAYRGELGKIGDAYTHVGNEISRIKKEHEGFINVLRLPSISHQSVLDAFGMQPGAKPSAPGLGGADAAAGGGGAGTAASEYDAEKARIEGRLEAIREGMLTEQELRLEKYEADMNLVEEAYNRELISAQQHNQMMVGLEKQMLEEKSKLNQQYWNGQLSSAASFFGSMAKVSESWGKKNNAVAKALGIAQALISTYTGATQALASAPFPANMAAFAAVLAKGMSAVAAITAVNPNGGGSARPIGGGSTSAGSVASTQQPQQAPRNAYLTIQGSTFNRDNARELVDQLNVFFKDGGGRIVLA